MSDPRPAAPLTGDAFAALIDPLLPDPPKAGVAVACSGGPDSMALALLARDWAGARAIACRAFIVDHGLRSDSGAEAEWTRARLEEAGLAARVLTREAVPAGGNAQALAREARYRLLRDACRVAGIRHLLLAHHRDDQAETFLLRLARGSGVAGLAAMRPRVEGGGLVLLRPLLDVPRARLAATLDAFGGRSVADPSNRDRRFARARLRDAAPDLAQIGLTPGRLAGTAWRLARAGDALRHYADKAFQAACDPGGRVDPRPYGGLWLDPEALGAAPAEIGLTVLARALRMVAGRDYPPRLRALERLYAALVRDRAPAPRTLHGCRLAPRGGAVLMAREGAGLPGPAPYAGPGMRWDNRFTLTGAAPGAGVAVAALGREGARAAADALGPAAPPVEVLAAVPALWRDGAPLSPAPSAAADGILRAGPLVAAFDPGGDVWPLAFSSEPGGPT